MSTTEAFAGEGMPGALDEISTRWTQIKDPVQFVLRYSRAIRAYLAALLKHPHDADDVSQEFVMRFLERGLAAADPDRGRFRDYLKVAVRRAALVHLRRQNGQPILDAGLDQLPDTADEPDADARWREEWRMCLIDRAWRGIESHVRRHPDCGYDVALTIARERPNVESSDRAALATQRLGRPISASAYRQMLQRGRSLLKDLIVREVSKTLRQPTPEAIDEELADLGLLALVRD